MDFLGLGPSFPKIFSGKAKKRFPFNGRRPSARFVCSHSVSCNIHCPSSFHGAVQSSFGWHSHLPTSPSNLWRLYWTHIKNSLQQSFLDSLTRMCWPIRHQSTFVVVLADGRHLHPHHSKLNVLRFILENGCYDYATRAQN